MEGRTSSTFNDRIDGLPSFEVGGVLFNSADDAAIFTFPLVRTMQGSNLGPNEGTNQGSNQGSNQGPNEVAMGVMLHANTVEGYLHLSRLAWPTIPPMVRSSFSSLIPDFLVVNERVWGEGYGGTLLAGFWGPNWEYVEADAYVNIL